MTIKFPGNRWINFRYRYWVNKKYYFSKLRDGFIVNYYRFTVIAKTKGEANKVS